MQPAPGTGNVHGVLTDPNGAPLPNMTINIVTAGTWSVQATTVTDQRGEFEFVEMPPGAYDVIFENPDDPRRSPTKKPVQVKPDEIVEVNGTVFPEPVDSGPCCKPYGAPPARRRVV